MSSFIVNINSLLKWKVNVAGHEIIDIGFMVSKSDKRGELQCCVTPISTGVRENRVVYKINSGDVIKIFSNESNSVVSYFTEEKINQLKNVYQYTNNGNPCKKQLHVAVDNHDRHIMLGSDTCDFIFDFFYASKKGLIEYSIGSIEGGGNEQWFKSFLSRKKSIEILYLNNQL